MDILGYDLQHFYFGMGDSLAADLKVTKSKWPKSVFIGGGTTGVSIN